MAMTIVSVLVLCVAVSTGSDSELNCGSESLLSRFIIAADAITLW
jgi:hypothetical protein